MIPASARLHAAVVEGQLPAPGRRRAAPARREHDHAPRTPRVAARQARRPHPERRDYRAAHGGRGGREPAGTRARARVRMTNLPTSLARGGSSPRESQLRHGDANGPAPTHLTGRSAPTPTAGHRRAFVRHRRHGCPCDRPARLALARSSLRPPLHLVQPSSERVRQAVRQDCSFAKKQASPPALLVVVRTGRVALGYGDARIQAQSGSLRPPARDHWLVGLGTSASGAPSS